MTYRVFPNLKPPVWLYSPTPTRRPRWPPYVGPPKWSL